MTTLSPFEVAKVNVAVVPPVTLDALNKGVIISTGGTNTDSGTITQVNNANPDILSDGTPITSSVHTRVSFSTQVLNKRSITALASNTIPLDGLSWSNGIATVTTDGVHGLPASSDLWVVLEGIVPTGWNGTRRITVTGTSTFTFLSDTDYGALVTLGAVSWAEATVTHLLPYLTPHDNNVYYVSVGQATVSSFNNTNAPAFAVDATTLIYPCKFLTFSGTPTAWLRYIKGTTASNHNIPQDNISYVGVTGTAPTNYNGNLLATATSATEVYYSAISGVNGVTTKGVVQAFVVTTASAHGEPIGIPEDVVIQGTSIASHNRSAKYLAATTTVLTSPFNSPVSLGTATGGKLLDADAFTLQTKLNGFFAQGSSVPVWVLELGADTIANSITTFANWLADNKNQYLNYLMPVGWDISAFASVASGYNGNLDFTEFLLPLSDVANKQLFYNATTGVGYKSVIPFIEDDNVQTFEFNPARALYEFSSMIPSAADPIRQQNYRYLIASLTEATPYAGTDRDTLDSLGITYVDTNAKGLAYPYKFVGCYTGDSINSGGITANLIDYSQWWSVYYTALTLQAALNKRVIDSANDPQQRLNLDDTGGVNCVNSLKATVQNVIDSQLVPFGAINATTVEAVPYFDWKAANPALYINKTYNGLSVAITPRRGFKKVIINLTANFNG